MRIRAGEAGDVGAVLALMDEAVAWLVARGQVDQWGDEPISTRLPFVRRVEEWQRLGWLRLATADDGEPLAALVVGDAPAYVRAAGEPELYVVLLVSSRRHAGAGVGAALVARALEEARAAGVSLVRVDCWAGAPDLVRWYEGRGFAPVERFRVGDWEGQLLEQRLESPGPRPMTPAWTRA